MENNNDSNSNNVNASVCRYAISSRILQWSISIGACVRRENVLPIPTRCCNDSNIVAVEADHIRGHNVSPGKAPETPNEARSSIISVCVFYFFSVYTISADGALAFQLSCFIRGIQLSYTNVRVHPTPGLSFPSEAILVVTIIIILHRYGQIFVPFEHVNRCFSVRHRSSRRYTVARVSVLFIRNEHVFHTKKTVSANRYEECH